MYARSKNMGTAINLRPTQDTPSLAKVLLSSSVSGFRANRHWTDVAERGRARELSQFSSMVRSADSPICDQRNPPFNCRLNDDRSAALVHPSGTRKESAMNRLVTWAVGGALLFAAAGLMIVNAQHRARFHCRRPARHRRAGTGQIAIGRMVEPCPLT